MLKNFTLISLWQPFMIMVRWKIDQGTDKIMNKIIKSVQSLFECHHIIIECVLCFDIQYLMICIPFLTYVKFSSLFSLERYCRISIGTIGRCHLQWFREYWFRITHHDVETFWAGGAMWFSQMVQGAKALALTQWRIVIQCPSEVCIHDYDQMTNDTHSNVMRVHLNYLKHFSNFPTETMEPFTLRRRSLNHAWNREQFVSKSTSRQQMKQ